MYCRSSACTFFLVQMFWSTTLYIGRCLMISDLFPSLLTVFVCLFSFRRSKLPRSRTNSTETLLRPPKPPTSAGRGKTTFKLSSSRGSSRASSRRSSVELASDEETWYDRASSLKSGSKKTRQVWGSSPQMNTATPTDRGRTVSKQNGKRLAVLSLSCSP